jgi:cytochrome c553
MQKWVLAVVLGVLGVTASAARGHGPTREEISFFETSIRPLLAENCYSCHGKEKQKGELRLDSRAAVMRGGELGAVIVAGKPEESLLIKAVKYTDADLQMPPQKKLSEKQVADLAKWVKMGVPWPGEEASGVAAVHAKPAGMQITDEDRKWWAFVPVARKAGNIDQFVSARLKEKGIEQNPPASKRELIRRAYFDLWGLPPTAQEVAAFEADQSPDAFEKVIDRLLASPRYGERWARHWLDVVRYAQTNGYERDGEKPYAWRYRDYVIKAFNEDKPYDQFVREQLAGDEIDRVTDDSLIATGFYRLGVWDDEPDDKKAAEYDYHDDNIRTISTAFLGLTVGCARCHEHKSDPIPQADYYSLLAFLKNVRHHEGPKYSADSATYVPLGNREKLAAWLSEREAKVKALKEELAKAEGKDEKKKIEAEIKEVNERKGPFEWALAVRESGAKPAKTHVLMRGNANAPGPEVRPAFLSVLGGEAAKPISSSESQQSAGLRLALAEWIVNKNNPLTARVMVNRTWQHHFGRGLVPTPDDFGKTGLLPTHPELLDYLAAKFMDEGWSMKRMHRLIMLSAAYRMSSRATNEKALEIDPDNSLLWRQTMRRLEAEAIRDSVLLVSGELNEKQGGRGFFPRLSREVIAGGSRPGDGWDISSSDELNRRSIYAYVKRTMTVPMLDTFDSNNSSLPSGERTTTTVAPQALMLLNDRFMHERARGFAKRIIAQAGADRSKQVTAAYEIALSRRPTQREMSIATQYLERQAKVAEQMLRRRMRFEPDVPGQMFTGYLKKLAASDLLFGPRTGWKYSRGIWGGGYESSMVVEPMQGPVAIAEGTKSADGTVSAVMQINAGCDVAGLLVRADLAGEELRSAYDLVVLPKTQSVALRRHSGKDVRVLATMEYPMVAGQSVSLTLAANGEMVIGHVDGKRIAAQDSQPLKEGEVGVRVWGAAVDVSEMQVNRDGKLHYVYDGKDEVNEKAVAALGLVLFNLNEFVYVD